MIMIMIILTIILIIFFRHSVLLSQGLYKL